MKKEYINYHCHTSYSNIMTSDSVMTYDNYIKRIKELDYGVLMSTEHGFQGNYLKAYSLSKENNIPFRYGVEAYWVMDNSIKDKTNNHIILLAKNNGGVKEINSLLSKANMYGYYYKPRIDIKGLLSLNPSNVFITTACIGFNGYGNEVSKNTILELYNHFQDNFMLEVQYHYTDKQKEWNKFLLSISKEYGIKIIAGMDSHYIYEKDKYYREKYLKAKGIHYDNENGWFMDFPDYKTAFNRFKIQDSLNENEIKQALSNTLVINTFDELTFNDNIKVPNLYPNKTFNERVILLKKILLNEWNKKKDVILKEKHREYLDRIKYELNIIIKTKMVDYFILHYEIMKKGKENGGLLTLASRGSSPSFYINNLLGFTTIDALNSPVELFPERFMSVSRILETRSIPDIDENEGNPNIFIQAQRDLLGENSTFYMGSYGTLKEKSAFKVYAKANDVDFLTANKVSSKITDYLKDKKHNEKVDIKYYLNNNELKLYEESKDYWGTIDNISPHPCAVITYSGNVLEDVGIVKVKNEFVTVIDGKYLEKFKYVKNDHLKVDVVNIIYKTFEKMGINPIPSDKLLEITKDDKKVWGIYKNGYTVGLNQVEQDSTKEKIMQYKPKNISELTAFVAGIRPGFNSMLDKFLKREHFEYGIPEFDKLIQTKEMKDSWILYQEQVMKVLQYAGFNSDETYGILKAVSKKQEDKINSIKNRFLKGFMSKENSIENANKVWNIIKDNSNYSFNASHALSVAIDSLYGAYFKAYYPYEFYATLLEIYTENKDLKKISKIKKEMQYFNIDIGEIKFGLDNNGFVIDRKNRKINQFLKTVKRINSQNCIDLKNIGGRHRNKSFVELLPILKNSSLNKIQLEVLIKIGYFNQYGDINKLLKYIEIYDLFSKTRISKKKVPKEYYDIVKKYSKETESNFTYIKDKKQEMLNVLFENVKYEPIEIIDKLKYELEFLGYIKDMPKNVSIGSVEMVSKKNRSINLKSLRTGQAKWFRIPKGLGIPDKKNYIIIDKIVSRVGWKGRKDIYIKEYRKLLDK